jgi:hypothetical protein
VDVSTINERIRAAVHESAHALVARCYGLKIQEVKLGPGKPVCNLWLEQTPGEQLRAAAACMAGSVGEEVAGLVPNPDGARHDRRQVRRLSLAGGEDEARAAARKLVRTYRGHVLGLASLLLLRGRLSGEEVARVLDTPPPRRAKLGLAAVACVQKAYRGGAWVDRLKSGRLHYARQVQEHGTWYEALAAAARAVAGPGREAITLPLADAAIDTYPDPPAR